MVSLRRNVARVGEEGVSSPWQHLIDKHRASLDAAKGIFTWTSEEELAWLAEEASRRWNALEIGTYKGHSAIVLARSIRDHVVCFDMCPDPGVEDEAKINLKNEPRIALIHRDAGVSAARWFQDSVVLFDMIWIDDGHTYADVVRDCLIALLLRTRNNPLICGHDYERPFNDVARAVNDCFGEKNIKFGPGTIWYL